MEKIAFVNLGFDNHVPVARISAVVRPDSQPIRRLITQAKDNNMLVDVTRNRPTRAVIVLDDGHIVTSASAPSTILERIRVPKVYAGGKELVEDESGTEEKA